nr:uncharacterized protein LOC108013036 isoform X3 [Drosophila suzukii]
MVFSVYQQYEFEIDHRKYRSFSFLSMLIWVIFLGLSAVLMVISGVVLIFGVKKENAPCGKSPQLCISNWVLDSCLSHSCTFLVLNNDKQIRGERVGRLTAS